MPEQRNVLSSTPPRIATRLTAAVPAGIATIALRGPDIEQIVLAFASLRVSQLEVGRIHYGTWSLGDTRNSSVPQEQIVVCRSEAQQIDLHCHGGIAVCDIILAQLQKAGFQHLQSGDWPSKQTCPVRTAAELALLHATSDHIARCLLAQRNGVLTAELEQILALLEDQDSTAIDQAKQRISTLLTRKWPGLFLNSPPRVVLAGPPNVGKSSLINRLVGRERAIVHDQPGTTRDWTESPVVWQGWPFALTDTAGLREAGNDIEREGIRRGIERIQQADILVLVGDAAAGLDPIHHQWLQSEKRKLWVWNKSDLYRDPARVLDAIPPEIEVLYTSAREEPGIDQLGDALVRMLYGEVSQSEIVPPLPFLPQHFETLENALEFLSNNQRPAARESLLSLLRPT